MPIIEPTESKLLEIAPGTYSARVTKITQSKGQFGPQLQFEFTLLDEQGEETDLSIISWCSEKWHKRSKLMEWSKALLRKRCPEPPDPIDTDMLLNKRCDIDIEYHQTADGSESRKVGKVYPFRAMNRPDDEPDEELPDDTPGELPF